MRVLTSLLLAAFILLTPPPTLPSISNIILSTGLSTVHTLSMDVADESAMTCSGFVIKTATVATANHCVGPVGSPVTVEKYDGRVLVRDDSTGVAVVNVAVAKNLLRIAKKAPLLGEALISVGYAEPAYNAIGISSEVIATDTAVLELPTGNILNKPSIQGMSGGPVVNRAGEVVGMIQASNTQAAYITSLANLVKTLKPFLPEHRPSPILSIPK